jgi:O-antigen ligase
VSCFLYWVSLDAKGLLKGFAFFIMLSLAAYIAIGPETVEKIIERRLFSQENTSSDETRTLQAQALMEQFDEAPFLGAGIGGYAQGLVREPTVKHLYEVQWIAFLMQFGVIGIVLLLIPLGLIALRLVMGSFSRVRCSFLGLFLLWIFSGFTNPFLISLASGTMYALFYLCGEVFLNKAQRVALR